MRSRVQWNVRTFSQFSPCIFHVGTCWNVERSHLMLTSQASSSSHPQDQTTHSTHYQWYNSTIAPTIAHKSHFAHSKTACMHSKNCMDEVLSATFRHLLFRLADLLVDRRRDSQQYQEEISFGQYLFACIEGPVLCRCSEAN